MNRPVIGATWPRRRSPDSARIRTPSRVAASTATRTFMAPTTRPTSRTSGRCGAEEGTMKAITFLMLTAIALPVVAEEPADAKKEAAASEENSEITALTRPESSIDVGFGYVVNDNYHFGQYRGLTDSGAYG